MVQKGTEYPNNAIGAVWPSCFSYYFTPNRKFRIFNNFLCPPNNAPLRSYVGVAPLRSYVGFATTLNLGILDTSYPDRNVKFITSKCSRNASEGHIICSLAVPCGFGSSKQNHLHALMWGAICHGLLIKKWRIAGWAGKFGLE